MRTVTPRPDEKRASWRRFQGEHPAKEQRERLDGVRAIGIACLVSFAALLIIGVASHEVVRHVMQGLPIAGAGALTLLNARAAKWVALATLLFWVGIAVVVWLFLLHIANIASGTYSPAEIAMTFVIAASGLYGWGVGGGLAGRERHRRNFGDGNLRRHSRSASRPHGVELPFPLGTRR